MLNTLCKVMGLACGVGLFPAAIGPSFLGKKVETGPTATQFGSACTQTMPCLLKYACGRQSCFR